MHKYVKIVIALTTVVAVGAVGFFAYKRFNIQNPDMQMNKDMGITEEVKKQSLQETITASGMVLLKDEIEVYAEGETNKIKSILVEEGDTIKAGQLLVEYDVEDNKEELEKKIRDTKREIQNGELSLKSLSTPADSSELTRLSNAITSKEKELQDAKANYNSYETKLTQQQTAIDNAKIDVENAQKNLDNASELLAVGGVSAQEVEDLEYELKKTQDTLTQAEDSYSEILDARTSAQQSIKTAENAVTEAKNSYNDAKNPLSTQADKLKYQQEQLSLQGLKDNLADYEKDLSELVYSTSSTVEGKVTEVCVDEGTYTEENTVILKLANFDQLIVSANVEEYDAPSLKLGQSVKMTSDGLEGKEYTGSIIKISQSAADTSTNMGTETTVPVEISVDNPDGVLKPGYNLDLEITIVEKSNLLMVSSGAVGKDGSGSYVYKVKDDDTIERVSVTTGDSNETLIEIISGLVEGDKIIRSLNENIKDGMTLDEITDLIKNERVNAAQSDENSNGGNKDDRNNQPNQMLPSGGFGGGGPGGGGPMGR